MPEGESSEGVPGRDEYPKPLRYELVLDAERQVKIGGALQLKVLRRDDGRLLVCVPSAGREMWCVAHKRDQYFLGLDPESLEALVPNVIYGASVPLELAPVQDWVVRPWRSGEVRPTDFVGPLRFDCEADPALKQVDGSYYLPSRGITVS